MHESYKEEVNVGNIINYVVAFCVEWCLSGCYRAGFFLEGRSKKESSRFSGIPIGAMLSPPAAWRVAFRWSRFDLIGVCGAALICLFLLQGRWLVLAECVVYVCCLVSLGLTTWHAVKAAEAVTVSNATGRSCRRWQE